MPNSIGCLVVDDERLARNNLRALLQGYSGLRILGEAATVQQAEESIVRLKPDLVFLDVQLGGGSGFDLLERLDPMPAIIFVTAFDRYAVRAFQVNALDYLLKPIDPERLKKALEKAVKNRASERKKRLSFKHQVETEDALLIPAGRSGYFIRVEDILSISVKGNYSTVLTQNGKTHMVLNTLRSWQSRLPESSFLRLGRKLIVNLRQVRKIEPTGRQIKLEIGNHGAHLFLQRAAADRLKRHLRA